MQQDSTFPQNPFQRSRRFETAFPVVRSGIIFWIGTVLIVFLAAVPRLMVSDFGLPYIEYIDEVQLYWYGQAARGLSEVKLSNITYYPPAFIQMHEVVQPLLEALERPGPAATIFALRTAAVIANLVGIVFLGLAGRLLAGTLAGWTAAAAWSVAPVVVEMSVLAIGESFVYPLMALCLWLLVGAWLRPDRWRWALTSLLVALLICLFEYRLVVMFLPGMSILLWRLSQKYALRTRFWLLAGLLAVAGVTAIVIALYLFGPARFSQWMTRILTRDLWDIPLLLEHITSTVDVLHWLPVVIVAGLGVAGWLWQRPAQRIDLRLLGLSVMLIVLIDWLATAVRWTDDQGVRIQNTLPATMIVCLLLGTGAASFVSLFRSARLARVIALGLLVLIAGVQLGPLAALVNNREVQNWQVVIRRWADVNISPGTVIVYGEHERTFNPLWGGIQGRHWFDWWPTENILEHPLDEWIEPRGMTYALLPVDQYNALEASPEGRALLSKMLRLRDFVHPPVRREPEGIFYRLWRMQHETDIQFGDRIRLTGYDQSAESARPGQSVDFIFYWNAPATPQDNYSLFVHLVPEAGYTVLAQVDGSPAVPERPTLSWNQPGETLISPSFTLTIPPDLPPGDYRVVIGLYNFTTGVRLPVAGSDLGDAYLLATLLVRAQP